MKFEGPQGAQGDVVTCTSNEFDDETIADFLETEGISDTTRVGNNFVVDDPFFKCGDYHENEIFTACGGPVGGETTCKSSSAKAGVEL